MKPYQVNKMPLCPFKTSAAHCVGDGCMAWTGKSCDRFHGEPAPGVQRRIDAAMAYQPDNSKWEAKNGR
ncbi:MAG: hypothetical protein LUC47_11555 [Clostridiales bacterium]|nr:hypothetical protein [Clostridiales bacterium]